jgi:3-deoxy-D-manno-octulosonic-acid transferase
MTRFAYALLWWLATPFAFLRLAWRARRQPGYLERWGERLGFYAPAQKVPRIWIHAVSLGETRAAAPLVEALTARYPRHRILLTHMTPTGRQAGRELFGDRVERAWLPYDHGFAVRRFLAHFAPAIGIVMETEIWPRLLEECARKAIPAVLANARLSERSARRYARWPRITRWALGNVAGIAAQTREDAARFEALGAGAPFVMGNVKFDMTVPQEMLERGAALRARLGDTRRVWVAGSTRDGEEALLLDAFLAANPDPSALLVIVPRHPQRFEEVAAAAVARCLAIARRSDNAPVPPQTRVVLGDSLGEMLAYYAAADVVVMGGSFLPFGSQNLIEACAVGRPVIVGPSTFNFEEAAARAIAEGAAVRVGDATEAIEQAARLSKDEGVRERMGLRGREFVAAHRGAVERFVDWLAPKVKP